MDYFNNVLTLCSNCKKRITVQSTYKDRNKKYKCDDCSNPFFKGYKPKFYFNTDKQ